MSLEGLLVLGLPRTVLLGLASSQHISAQGLHMSLEGLLAQILYDCILVIRIKSDAPNLKVRPTSL